jgi:hypothetical protein
LKAITAPERHPAGRYRRITALYLSIKALFEDQTVDLVSVACLYRSTTCLFRHETCLYQHLKCLWPLGHPGGPPPPSLRSLSRTPPFEREAQSVHAGTWALRRDSLQVVRPSTHACSPSRKACAAAFPACESHLRSDKRHESLEAPPLQAESGFTVASSVDTLVERLTPRGSRLESSASWVTDSRT